MSDNKAAGNIILILASLPDFLRKPMMQARLKEFFNMAEAERQETIAMALAAAPSIDPAKLSVLVKTWLEIISEFDPEKRAILFKTYSQQIMSNPGPVQKLDFPSLTNTFNSLNDRQRETIIDSLHETLFTLPNRQAVVNIIPEQTRRVLKLSR